MKAIVAGVIGGAAIGLMFVGVTGSLSSGLLAGLFAGIAFFAASLRGN